jgi:hypothetical protein
MTHSFCRSVLLFLFALAGCSGKGLDQGGSLDLGTPTKHRPTPQSCPLQTGTCPSSAPDMGSSCTTDKACTASAHGHCDQIRGGCTCDYDVCTSDNDCPTNNVCVCGDAIGAMPANTCVPGNCRVDGDCGAGGFCSMSLGMGCIPRIPVQGYFCHTKADTCANDTDCNGSGGGYCAWHAELGHWACSYILCAG